MDIPETWPPDAVERVQGLIRDNGKLAARIMTLQREGNQVTDLDIRDRFGKLYNNILDWVRDVQQDLEPSGWGFQDFQRTLQENSAKTKLMELLRWTENKSPPSDMQKYTPFEVAWADWLAAHSTSLYVVFTLVIWRCLESEIFNLSLPLGLDLPSETSNVLNAIMETMDTAEDGGAVPSNKWRSATNTALARTPRCQALKRRRLQGILVLLLNEWPFADVSKSLSNIQIEKLQENVVEFTVELQEDMVCSTSRFEKEYPTVLRGNSLEDAEVRKWNLRNVCQWIPEESNRGIRGAFHCLFPAIFRPETSERGRVDVVKPVVLVFDDFSPPPPSRSTTPVPNLQQSERSLSPAPSPVAPPVPAHALSNKDHKGVGSRHRRGSVSKKIESEIPKSSRDGKGTNSRPKTPAKQQRGREARSRRSSLDVFTSIIDPIPSPSSQSSLSETCKASKSSSRHKTKEKAGPKHTRSLISGHHTSHRKPETVPEDMSLEDRLPTQTEDYPRESDDKREEQPRESISNGKYTNVYSEEPESSVAYVSTWGRYLPYSQTNYQTPRTGDVPHSKTY